MSVREDLLAAMHDLNRAQHSLAMALAHDSTAGLEGVRRDISSADRCLATISQPANPHRGMAILLEDIAQRARA
ncbi:hypothetical protein [Roseinatronobacter alkalisoli]|uniref:Histidine kinase n=1 Tax=Roseinatronobacter alkalisoli TaxID=3028235 RepID=A0ABT5TE82_9RHOB|nr:hypothetical protein [Roseinatronobacter sp. HJB301]MDD7972482.1 hypothetical protein [Roseinatronobacter sp. HJB301]